MNPRTSELILFATLALTVSLTLARYPVGRSVLAALLVAALLTLGVLLLRCLNEPLFRRLHACPGLARPLDALLRAARLAPLPPLTDAETRWLRLEGPEDYAAAARAIKREVLGQDGAVDRVLRRIETAIGARAGVNPARPLPPLAALLLVGEAGLGKRFLASRVNQQLFLDGGFWHYDVNELGPAAALDFIFGPDPDALPTRLRQRPYGTVVIENVDALPASKVHRLLDVLDPDRVHGAPASVSASAYQSCLFFFTTTRMAEDLRREAARGADPGEWPLQAVETLSAGGRAVDADLLAHVREAIVFSLPDDLVVAQVIESMIREEFARARVAALRLELMIGALVYEFTPEGRLPASGFASLRGRVRARVEPYIKFCKDHDLAEIEVDPHRKLADPLLPNPRP